MINIRVRSERTARNSFRSMSDGMIRQDLQKGAVRKLLPFFKGLHCDNPTHEAYVNEIFINENADRIEFGNICCPKFKAKLITHLSLYAPVNITSA